MTGENSVSGQPFDFQRTSDFDIALASPELLEKAKSLGVAVRSGGTRTVPLRANDLKELGLTDSANQLTSLTGREVNFMIFGSATSAIRCAPSILLPRK